MKMGFRSLDVPVRYFIDIFLARVSAWREESLRTFPRDVHMPAKVSRR